MKTVEQSLYQLFCDNPTQRYHSGHLQRMTFKNKNGTLATPASVTRRLRELAEEGKIVNVGSTREAIYTLNGLPPKRYKIEIRDNVAYRVLV